MIRITLNGKPLDESSLEGAMVEMVVAHLRETLGAIRHPETGEFPTIAVTGTNLGSLQCQVEGSPELLALVQARLADETSDELVQPDAEATEAAPSATPTTPVAFLSYAFEDRELARRIAEGLMAQGVDTWWAEWCIASGDSIRQRVDEGIGRCTHFIVLLTPQSIGKPWVNLEIDAGLMRRLGEGIKFVPLRCGVSVDSLSFVLRPMHSPEVDAQTLDVSQLVGDVLGVTRKPPLGSPSAAVTAASPLSGHSAAAMALARYFVQSSQTGQKFDPQCEPEKLASTLGLSEEDLSDAVHELRGLVTDHLGYLLFPEDSLFARFDKYWMPWDPEADALRVAAGLVNDKTFPDKPVDMAELLGWSARRLNPALAYLCDRRLVRDVRAMDGTNFLAYRIDKTDATRRFVKSRN